MAKKEIPPTNEEIKRMVWEWEHMDYDSLVKLGYFEDKQKKIVRRPMTALLMLHAPDEGRERIWKYCKELARYGHCPVKPAEYYRMEAFSEDKVLIDTVVSALDEVVYPYETTDEFRPNDDIEGYFYCVSLLSQARYRREDCLALLKRISGFIREKIFYDTPKIVFGRNIDILKDKHPDLVGL